jgi:hypothetical protein
MLEQLLLKIAMQKTLGTFTANHDVAKIVLNPEQ